MTNKKGITEKKLLIENLLKVEVNVENILLENGDIDAEATLSNLLNEYYLQELRFEVIISLLSEDIEMDAEKINFFKTGRGIPLNELSNLISDYCSIITKEYLEKKRLPPNSLISVYKTYNYLKENYYGEI